MLVCHCYKVCDRVIRQCIRAGAESVAEVKAICSVGAACGGCLPLVERLVRSEQAQITEARAVTSPDATGAQALRSLTA